MSPPAVDGSAPAGDTNSIRKQCRNGRASENQFKLYETSSAAKFMERSIYFQEVIAWSELGDDAEG